MGRPGVGNPGNKGGRRPSAYQEIANAALLAEMFFGKLDREEIKAKLASGKYSLKDIWVSKGFSGNEKVLTEIFKKLFPDFKNVDVTSGGKPVFFPTEILTKNELTNDQETDDQNTIS